MTRVNNWRFCRVWSGWMVFFVSVASFPLFVFAMPQEDLARSEAVELWERMIEARGGRARLHQIENILITKTFSGKDTARFERAEHLNVDLVVFPDRSWTWIDHRPDVFGLTVHMLNYSDDVDYLLGDSETNPQGVLRKRDTSSSKGHPFASFLLYEALETRWVQLIPYKAETRWRGMRRYDVLYVRIEGYEYKARYFLDRDSHLPMRVEIFADDSYFNDSLEYLDFVEVDGIMVPSKIREARGVSDLTYQFNVEYDEDLFKIPPSIEAGPGAWRPKVKD